LDIYEPSQFDQRVTALFNAAFSEQLRAFLDKPEEEDAIIETTVIYTQMHNNTQTLNCYLG
jgi:hypothetical protein